MENEHFILIVLVTMGGLIVVLIAGLLILIKWNRQLYKENREITIEGITTMQKAIQSFYSLREQMQTDGFALMGKLNQSYDEIIKRLDETTKTITEHLQYLRDHVKR